MSAPAMDQDRLRRIRNFQSDDWYAALFIRPLTILVMLVIADWRALTPNRLTTLANLAKLGCAGIIALRLPGDLAPTIWAVALLQLGILFDHLDGTMARYRRTFTRFGSFYDKVSDLITWFLIALAVGWVAYRQTGEAYYIALAVASSFALDIRGYMKWLNVAESERLRWLEARDDPAAAVARRTAPIVVPPPPERSRRDWLIWGLKMAPQFVRFEEMDLYFWVGLGLLIGRADWLVWLMFVSQIIGMVIMVIRRTREIIAVDRQMRELGG
jgi:phosphatidylglycerophosphate synthase